MQARVRLAALMTALAIAAFGQDSPHAATVGAAAMSRVAGPGVPMAAPARTGAPYSAEQTIERTETQTDGTEAVQEIRQSRVCRDSAGRTRTEPLSQAGATPVRAKGMPVPSPVTLIIDPVAHVMYRLDAAERVAHMRAMHSQGSLSALPGGSAAAAGAVRPAPHSPPRLPNDARRQVATEKLEDRNMEGLPVKGTRRTITWASGSRGNDQPFTVITETWMSPDLRIMVLNKTHDPRIGNFTRRLSHITRAEPDASLFRPPAGYTIVDDDEAGRSAESERAATARAALAPMPQPAPPQPASPVEPAAQPPIAAQAEPVAQPDPAPASAKDEPLASDMTDAPPDALVDGDYPPDYVGVDAVYVGIGGANPPRPNMAKPSVALPASGSTPPVRRKPPNPKVPKAPSPEKRAQ